MKTVTIPSNNNPWNCNINGVAYSYPAGSTQTVPDEVAGLIDNINKNAPKEAAEKGTQGQVWTKKNKGADWDNIPTYTLPAATATNIGGVKLGTAVADASDAASAITQINALIASLVAAGAIAEYVAPAEADPGEE